MSIYKETNLENNAMRTIFMTFCIVIYSYIHSHTSKCLQNIL